MLHVLNGDATFAALKPLQLEGRALVWRDALMEGPTPNGLQGESDWALRARWLAKHAGLSERGYLEGLRAFFKDFAQSAMEAKGEVVLWFEEDLFCQLPLCYLLAMKNEEAKWSVVCREDRLGVTPTDRLAVLFDERQAAEPALSSLATRAWDAYGASEPLRVQALVESADFAAWPLLQRGLRLHLARFPSAKNGANVVENAILDELATGPVDFAALYPRLQARPEIRDYGMGDQQVALDAWRLAHADAPLLTIEGAASDEMRPGTIESCARWRLERTPEGAAVAQGRTRAAMPEQWLGGAHLARGGGAWRWDEAAGRLVAL